eukprot:6184044-Pleurochrysis_carterae.AAC.1
MHGLGDATGHSRPYASLLQCAETGQLADELRPTSCEGSCYLGSSPFIAILDDIYQRSWSHTLGVFRAA